MRKGIPDVYRILLATILTVALITTMFGITPAVAYAATPLITLDGDFSDWSGQMHINDPIGDATVAHRDITAFYWANNPDDETCYWMLERVQATSTMRYLVFFDANNNGIYTDHVDRLIQVIYTISKKKSKVSVIVRFADTGQKISEVKNKDWGQSSNEGGRRVEFGASFADLGTGVGHTIRMYAICYQGGVGSGTATIRVEQKGKDGGTVFEEGVLAGNEFTFNGVDKKGTLGKEVSIYVNDTLNTNIHTSCSKPIGPGLVSDDFEVVEGYSKDGGLLCPITPVEGECDDCEGKVTQLTLRYNGDVEAIIIVEQKGKDGGVVFEGIVQPAGEFVFDGTDKKGTLGKDISIYINNTLNTRIHTSCSKPIGPGLVSDDFEVVEGYSKDGGLLCPITPAEDECDDCKGKVTQLTLKYNGIQGDIYDTTYEDERDEFKGTNSYIIDRVPDSGDVQWSPVAVLGYPLLVAVMLLGGTAIWYFTGRRKWNSL